MLLMPSDTELADNTTIHLKMLPMFKVSFICLINSTKAISNHILNWFMLWKFCSFYMLNMNSTAPLLQSDISHLQELTSTLQLLVQLVPSMDPNTEEPIKLS